MSTILSAIESSKSVVPTELETAAKTFRLPVDKATNNAHSRPRPQEAHETKQKTLLKAAAGSIRNGAALHIFVMMK